MVELILVMTMMVIVLGVAAPSLSRFFRGRTLDSEAKRFLALTRYGQSRAVAEGIPVLLWIDPQQKTYGLQADSSYVPQDSNAREFRLDADVQVEVEQSAAARKFTSLWRGNGGIAPTLPRIRFTPDGYIGEASPELVVFRGPDQGQVGIRESQTRSAYEIETNPYQNFRR